MARRNADVQLVIRAKDEADRTIRSVAEAMSLLGDAQSDVAAGASKTGSKLDQLIAGLAGLESLNRKMASSTEAASAAISRQAQSLVATNRAITDRKARVAELQRALTMLSAEADKAFIGPKRDGLSGTIANVKSELKTAQTEIGRLSSTFNQQLTGLRNARESFRGITTAQREADAAVASFTAEITTQTNALNQNARAAKQAQAAQAFFNNKFAPGLNSTGTTDSDRKEIAAVLRVAEARDAGILKLREEQAATDALAAAQERMARARAMYNARGSGAQDNGSPALKAADTQLAKSQIEAANAMERMQDEADQLRARLNPLAVVEQRLAAETAKLNKMQAAGVITTAEYDAALKLLGNDAKRTAAAINGANGIGADGKGAPFGLRPHELQNLSYQVNDLFTQVASGTSVMQAAAQQGGQIVQIFPRAGAAIMGAFTSAPLLAFVAVLAVVGLALKRVLNDAESLREFEGLLTATGQAAGMQAAGLVEAVRELDRYGLSAEEAVAAARVFVKEGLNQDALEDYGKAAKDMADVLKIDVGDALQLLIDGTTGGFESVQKLQNATGLFTDAELARIEALYASGRAQEAQTAIMEKARRTYAKAAEEANGPWTKAARNLGVAWTNTMSALANSDAIQGLGKGMLLLAENTVRATDELNKMSALSIFGEMAKFAASPGGYMLFGKFGANIGGSTPQPSTTTTAAAGATDQATANSSVLAANDAKRQAANARLTEDMRRQEVSAKEITSQQVLQEKLTEFRRKALADIQNNQDYKFADDATRAAVVDRQVAQERLKLEAQLADYLKKQADERARALKEAGSMVNITKDLLRKQEGFKSGAYWDVNAFRAGYGSDTVTSETGRVSRVTKGTTVTREGAERDLARRIEEFAAVVKNELGSERYAALSNQQQAVMTSIAYNYGNLAATGALKTFKEGTVDEVVAAIRGLGGHNNGVNRDRRNREAALFDTPNMAVESNTAEQEQKRAEAQAKFNAEVDAENLKRQQTIALATQMQGLQGAALIDAEKARFVEEAVNAQKAKAAKEQLTYTAAQEAATRALAAAEFEATRGVQARADAARKAVDQPVDQLAGLRGQLQGDMQTAAASGNTGRVKEIETQLAGVNTKLREATTLALQFYQTLNPGTTLFPGTQAELDAMIAKLKTIRDQAKDVNVYFGITGDTIAQTFAQTATSAIDKFSQQVAEGRNVFGALGDMFQQFAADFLRQIAQMIIQQTIFNLVSMALGGGGVPTAHGGGVIGKGMGTSKSISPAWFAGAPRYHTGGIAGLKPNEVPAILERGEEVLTRDDPRHQLNGGGSGGGAAPNIKIVNALNAGEMVSEGLGSAAGSQAFFNFIKANKRAVREVMG